jgi:plasmid stabilization system protein ParE
MNRKLVWTEEASSDIEAIVRYIARRDPKAAARIGLGIYDRAQIETRSFPNSLAATLAVLPSMSPVPPVSFFLSIRKPEQSSTNYAKVAGESSSSGVGKLFTRFVETSSLSDGARRTSANRIR